MVIEKLRQNAQREAAARHAQEQAQEQERTAQRRSKRRSGRSPISPALVRHPQFTLILTVWGAALAGLSVAMLPGFTIARLSMFAGLGALGDLARIVFALIAAVPGAGLGLGLGLALRRGFGKSSPPSSVASMAARRVRPINPAAELGSASLDAPLEDMPFGGAMSDPGEAAAPAAEDDPLELHDPLAEELHEPGDADESDAAHPLDLAQFAAPEPDGEADRDDETDSADEAERQPAPEPLQAPANIAPQQATSGIEQLRSVPPQELSLVQLVERFAAALHDAQASGPRAGLPTAPGSSEAGREAALAEALKALALFSERGFDVPPTGSPSPDQQPRAGEIAGQPARFGASFGGQASSAGLDRAKTTESDLREALARLQKLRGAA